MRMCPAVIASIVLVFTSTALASTVTFLGTSPAVVLQPPVPAAQIDNFAVDPVGRYYFADSEAGTIIRVAPSGLQTVLATGLKQPRIAVNYHGDVFVADTGNNRILSIPAGDTSPLVRASVKTPVSIATDTQDDIFYLAQNELYEIIRNGSPRRVGSFPGALLIAYGPSVAENDTIYVLSRQNSTYTVSTYTFHNGNGTIATLETFSSTDPIQGFVLDAAGNLLFSAGAGSATYIFQVSPLGQKDVLTQVPPGITPGLAVDINRNLYYLDSSGVNQIMKGAVNFGSIYFDGRGNFFQQLLLNFSVPPDVTISQDTYGAPAGQYGAFFDADYPPPGTCSPGVTECTIYVTYTPSGIPGADTATMALLDPDGKLLLQIPLYGRGIVNFTNLYPAGFPLSSTDIYPYPKLKSPAGITNSNALLITDTGTGTVGTTKGLKAPQTVAASPAFGTYVTESGQAGVLRIAPDGTQTRVAERLVTEPNGVAVDDAGNLYISDRNSIFRVGVDGTETQLADPSTDSGLLEVESLTASGAGTVYAFFGRGGASGSGGLVQIDPAGEVTPMAVPASVASATGLGIDDGGGLYFSDGISRTLSTLRTDGSFLTLFTGLERPKGVRGSGGPIIVDQEARKLYAPLPVQYDVFDVLSNQYNGTNTIDFGNVPLGSSVTKTYIALNEGNGEGGVGFSLDLAPGVSSEFSFTPANGASLAPGASQVVTFTFTPTAPGANTTIAFGGTGYEYSGDYENFIYLTGTGIAPPTK